MAHANGVQLVNAWRIAGSSGNALTCQRISSIPAAESAFSMFASVSGRDAFSCVLSLSFTAPRIDESLRHTIKSMHHTDDAIVPLVEIKSLMHSMYLR